MNRQYWPRASLDTRGYSRSAASRGGWQRGDRRAVEASRAGVTERSREGDAHTRMRRVHRCPASVCELCTRRATAAGRGRCASPAFRIGGERRALACALDRFGRRARACTLVHLSVHPYAPVRACPCTCAHARADVPIEVGKQRRGDVSQTQGTKTERKQILFEIERLYSCPLRCDAGSSDKLKCTHKYSERINRVRLRLVVELASEAHSINSNTIEALIVYIIIFSTVQ
jgi:hypothetical protein